MRKGEWRERERRTEIGGPERAGEAERGRERETRGRDEGTEGRKGGRKERKKKGGKKERETETRREKM